MITYIDKAEAVEYQKELASQGVNSKLVRIRDKETRQPAYGVQIVKSKVSKVRPPRNTMQTAGRLLGTIRKEAASLYKSFNTPNSPKRMRIGNLPSEKPPIARVEKGLGSRLKDERFGRDLRG